VFPGSCALLDDGNLLSWVDRDIDDLYLRQAQEFVNARANLLDSMFFGRVFRFLAILVCDSNDLEARFLVGGQMRIVDDPTGTYNADPAVHALGQFRFVVELRKDICHIRILTVLYNGKL
jgi:hypothetical protein